MEWFRYTGISGGMQPHIYYANTSRCDIEEQLNNKKYKKVPLRFLSCDKTYSYICIIYSKAGYVVGGDTNLFRIPANFVKCIGRYIPRDVNIMIYKRDPSGSNVC